MAALVIDGIDCPTIPLGQHLDDWIDDNYFLLRGVLIMGYPPIPLSNRNAIVCTRAEVNAVVDPYIGRHPRFIVSAMARGGFSGAPCLSEADFLLGMVISSSVKDHAPEELGYMTVLTVEPILECLAANRLMSKDLAETWDGLFTSQTIYLNHLDFRQAWIETDSDGHRTRVRFGCPDPEAIEAALRSVREGLAEGTYIYRLVSPAMHELMLDGEREASESSMHNAARAIQQAFEHRGFVPSSHL